jgi:hypothetical protein
LRKELLSAARRTPIFGTMRAKDAVAKRAVQIEESVLLFVAVPDPD